MKKYFTVGKIVNTHGVRGELRVISSSDFTEERYQVGSELVVKKKDASYHDLIVSSHRKHKNFDLLSFENYDNLNDVVWMKGLELKVSDEYHGPLDENEFYFHEIIGCKVMTREGESIGKVTGILTPGANDVWVVETPNQEEILIPYIADVVKSVDISKKLITIELMDGLLS